MYCRLTTFQVAIYFSIHAVKHPSSFFDNDAPGEGMHFSKQCSFTFCQENGLVSSVRIGAAQFDILISIAAHCLLPFVVVFH